MHAHSCSVAQPYLSATPWTVTHRLLCPLDSLGKNTRVGCHFLLQGSFLTQGLNLRLLYPLHLCIAGRFLPLWATWEAQRLGSPGSKCQRGRFHQEASSLGILGGCHLTLGSHSLFSVPMGQGARASWCLSFKSYYKGTNPVRPGPAIMTSSNLNYLPKSPSLNPFS